MRLLAMLAVSLLAFCDNSQAQEVAAVKSALRELKENWYGIDAQFESINLDQASEKKTDKIRIWMNNDGAAFRSFEKREYEIKTGDTRFQNVWRYVTPKMLFTRSISWINEGDRLRTVDTARVTGKKEPLYFENAISPANYFLGLDRFSGLYWYELLEDPATTISTSTIQNLTKASVQHRLLGEYEFSFEQNEGLKLKKVVCKNGRFSTTRDGIQAFEYEIDNIVYTKFEDQFFVESIGKIVETRQNSTGKKRTLRLKQNLTEQARLSEMLTNRISFPDFDLDDGTTVRVQNDEGIPYEVRDGLLVRVVDGNALVDSEAAQFREPDGFGVWWYLGMALIALVGFGLLFYWKR